MPEPEPLTTTERSRDYWWDVFLLERWASAQLDFFWPFFNLYLSCATCTKTYVTKNRCPLNTSATGLKRQPGHMGKVPFFMLPTGVRCKASLNSYCCYKASQTSVCHVSASAIFMMKRLCMCRHTHCHIFTRGEKKTELLHFGVNLKLPTETEVYSSRINI